jgi:AsmA protein
MRWIVRLIAAVGVLALLAIAVVVFLPAERVAGIAAQRIEAATGRAVSVDGPVRANLWPHVAVTTGPVTLAGPGWSEEGPMLTAEALEIRLDAATLFAGEPRIVAIEAVRPRILVERMADGRLNWDLAPSDAAVVAEGTSAAAPAGPATAGRAQPAGLDLLRLRGGSLTVIDHAAGTRLALTDLDLEFTAPDLAGPAALEVSARLGGLPLAVEARTEALPRLGAGGVAPLTLAARLGGTRLDFDGRAGLAPLQAEGQLSLAGRDLASVLAALGAGVALPDGLGRDGLEFAGRVTLSPDGSLHLRDSTLALEGNRLALSADLQPASPRPRLAAEITARTLDLSRHTAAAPARAGGGGGGGGGDAGWPRARIDASALGLLDADIALAADAVDLGHTKLGPTRARLVIDNARAVLDIGETTLHGGRVSGQLVANARSGFSARADLSFSDVALQPILRALADSDRLIAPATGQVSLLGVGDSVAALMASLSGEGRIALGRGELRGLDIAGMLRTLDPAFVGEGQRTIFDSVTASFTVRDGVLRNDDLVMAAPLLRATGAGTVDLGARRLDYRVTPVALQRDDGSGGVRVPLVVSGPWHNLRYRLDVEAIARDRLEDRVRSEAEELERRAREAIEREAERALGARPGSGDGGSVEDALRERLEREVGRGLGRLLGRN